jgi:hypothetical protein
MVHVGPSFLLKRKTLTSALVITKTFVSCFGSSDVFLAKYDGYGNYVLASTMGIREWDDPLCLTIQQKGLDSVKSIYLISRFNRATISFSI